MATTVKLSEIIDALEMQFDEASSFLDLDTGEVESVSHDLLSTAEVSGDDEEGPDLPKWQEREWEIAKRVVSTNSFRKLPTKYDIHEWEIMLDFSNSMKREKIREDLLYAIHGAGAFRSFKAAIRRHHIEPAWFAFRAKALRQIAIDWCEENDIAWE